MPNVLFVFICVVISVHLCCSFLTRINPDDVLTQMNSDVLFVCIRVFYLCLSVLEKALKIKELRVLGKKK